jgi:hypothetical protein
MIALIFFWAVAAVAQDWKPLTDWKQTAFPGAGKIVWDGPKVQMGPGAPMTGITAGAFKLKNAYEIRFKATRVMGNDFFCSLTFPYGDSFATWVNGGWGGDIVGISSIDNWDASENETRQYFNFENGREYLFRLEVKPELIRAYIDERKIVDLAVNGRAIGLRRGMAVTVPLSIFSYNTAAAIRDIEYRPLASR